MVLLELSIFLGQTDTNWWFLLRILILFLGIIKLTILGTIKQSRFRSLSVMLIFVNLFYISFWTFKSLSTCTDMQKCATSSMTLMSSLQGLDKASCSVAAGWTICLFRKHVGLLSASCLESGYHKNALELEIAQRRILVKVYLQEISVKWWAVPRVFQPCLAILQGRSLWWIMTSILIWIWMRLW